MTEGEIEEAAQRIYLARAIEAKVGHRQGIVPWHQLGESLKHSYRVEARGPGGQAPDGRAETG